MRVKADPRWKRATEGRRPKERSETGGSPVSRAGIPKRPLPNCQAGPTASSAPLFSTPRCRGVGTPSWTGPLTTSLRGLWVSGNLSRAMADRAQGRRPENRPCGDDSDPGQSQENASQLPEEVLSQPAWSASTHSEGKGPEDPGASCTAHRGNCRLQLLQTECLFPLGAPVSVHRQFAEFPCCPSETCSANCAADCRDSPGAVAHSRLSMSSTSPLLRRRSSWSRLS